jgi:hypothetical protein
MNKVRCSECMSNGIFTEKDWKNGMTLTGCSYKSLLGDRNTCQLMLNQLKVQMVVQEINVWKNRH